MADLVAIITEHLHPEPPSCPNCFSTHTKEEFDDSRCVIRALLSLAVEIKGLPIEEALAVYPKLNEIAIWDDLDPLLEKLIAGAYHYDD
jgi:hypothetical protein